MMLQGDTSSTPVEVQTFVTGATLHAFGKELALPIRCLLACCIFVSITAQNTALGAYKVRGS